MLVIPVKSLQPWCMSKQEPAAEAYNRFVEQVLETEQIWGLCAPDGAWAVVESQLEEGSDVVLVWGDRKEALALAKAEWSGFKPVSISLQEFVDQWLRGMHYDGGLVGPNWDAELNGSELKPAVVAHRLLEE